MSKHRRMKLLGYEFSYGVLFLRLPNVVEVGLDFNLAELKEWKFWRAVIAELLGSMFFLYFTVSTIAYRTDFTQPSKGKELSSSDQALATNIGSLGASAQLMIAAQFGAFIAVMVYVLAPVSGGHVNPAITFSLAVVKKVTLVRAVCYIAAQVGGAIIGTLIAASPDHGAFMAAGGAINGSTKYSARALFVPELMATALLLSVVSAAIDSTRAATVIHIGALGPLAIGMAVFVAHLALIPLDGCSINPARSMGPAVVFGSWRQHWVFWAGPGVGGVVAAISYEIFLRAR